MPLQNIVTFKAANPNENIVYQLDNDRYLYHLSIEKSDSDNHVLVITSHLPKTHKAFKIIDVRDKLKGANNFIIENAVRNELVFCSVSEVRTVMLQGNVNIGHYDVTLGATQELGDDEEESTLLPHI